MKKILLFTACAFFVTTIFAQKTPATPKKKEPINLGNRANDHFLLQYGFTQWSGKPDTITTGGLSNSLNFYLMVDYPFKTNPHLSMAFGPGIASDHISFKKTYVGIKDQTTVFRFTDQSDTNHFKKTKLITVWLEAPIEFRYSANPLGTGFKAAFGVKVGTLLKAFTTNKDLQTKSGSSLNNYSVKEYSKKFFNGNRLSIMGRVGYGHFSLYGNYQVTALLKDGKGAIMRPYSIGITLSGL